MRLLKNNFSVILVFSFLLAQPILSFIFNPKYYSDLPALSWSDLRTGAYGIELEKKLVEGSYFSKVGNESYRWLLYKLFSRLSNNVTVGKKQFLFLPERTNEINQVMLSETTETVVAKIKNFHNILKSRGIPLLIVIPPNRSRTYSDFAYKTGRIPPRRKSFFDDLYIRLSKEKIPFLLLDEEMLKMRVESNVPVYYKNDHHWTFEAVELVSPFIVNAFEELYGSIPREYKRIYDYKWSDAYNSHFSLGRKLGFSKTSLPVKFKEKQRIPKFSKVRKNVKPSGRLMLLSASYGNYGLVEFLSNELGYQIPFHVSAGQGALYSPSKFIQRNINQYEKNGLPKGVIWLFPEYHIRHNLSNNVYFPEAIDFKEYEYVDFDIEVTAGGEMGKSGELIQMSEVLKFNIRFKKDVKELFINISGSKGIKKPVISYRGSSVSKQRYIIVHDSEENKFHFSSSEPKTIHKFEIDTRHLEGHRFFKLKAYNKRY